MKIDLIKSEIQSLIIHKVGNKIADEKSVLSKSTAKLNTDLKLLLSHYFLSHFKSDEQYHFFHDV